MPVDIKITGADDLAALTKKLKQIGDNDLRKEMLKGIRTATKPMIAAARDNARASLPKHGGLNEVVAKSKFSARTRTAGRNPGVRVIGTSGIDIDMMDRRGKIRHPVFGNRDAWVTQDVKPGWFTDAMEHSAHEVRAGVQQALDDVARKL